MAEPTTVAVVTQAKEPAGDIALPAGVFDGPVRKHLLYEVVNMQRANKRAGTHATKTRGEVSGGGQKPWRQKGTGRARAGTSRSPIWSGGGVVFGPSPRKYTVKVNRKARRAALRAVGSRRARDAARARRQRLRRAVDQAGGRAAARPPRRVGARCPLRQR